MWCVGLSRLALRTETIHNGMQGKSIAFVYKHITLSCPPWRCLEESKATHEHTDGRTRNTVLYISGIDRARIAFQVSFVNIDFTGAG